MNIKLPDEVRFILTALGNSGYEAYAVGGCVRDSLLGKEPADWDVCTSALPEQTMQCFEGRHVIETGLRHGTVTLMLDSRHIEITTYRVDGAYTDGRRPDNVTFVRSLKEDLARRDFTVNAMAYNPERGVADFFGGSEDLNRGIIRCVGNADGRFQEDSLRILRALRFAAVLGFSIDRDTANAMHRNRELLSRISAERIATELNKLLLGGRVREVMLEHIPVIEVIIPEITRTIGFEQNSPYHGFDVLNHILHSVENAPGDIAVRLTMLLHDIGKPLCYAESEDGTGHFYGHARVSSDMAEVILSRLKYDKRTIETVTQLVLYHGCEIKNERQIKRWLNKIGEERFRQLIEVKKADVSAQASEFRNERMVALNGLLTLTDEIIACQQCFSLKDLAVNGRDLIAAGVPQGKAIGLMLNRLLDMVIEGGAENRKQVLLEIAKNMQTES